MVAEKRGNARGAKGPCRIHAGFEGEESRLDTCPTTERREQSMPSDAPPAPPEVKNGVRLPPKLSTLRSTLGQKAKQHVNAPDRMTTGESVHAPLQRLGLRLLGSAYR